jgi:ribosomal-protein-alanine N-acetyltransferase
MTRQHSASGGEGVPGSGFGDSPPPPFRIETERLIIRPWAPPDEPGFRQMVADPEMMRYISHGQPWSEERIAEFFARQNRHLAARGHCLGALIERATGRIAGLSGLQPMGTTADVEIGWWVMRDRWGRGLGTEAGAGALRHAWETLGLRRVTAVALPANRASIHIMEKLGMRYERHATGRELGLAAPDVEVVVYAIERGAGADVAPRSPAGT